MTSSTIEIDPNYPQQRFPAMTAVKNQFVCCRTVLNFLNDPLRLDHRVPHTEVSLLWENRKVVFTEIAGGHVLSKCPKERHSPPWNIKFHYVFRGVTASL